MTDNLIYHQQPPSLWSLYKRIIIPSATCKNQNKHPKKSVLPACTLLAARTDPNRLHAFRQVCELAEQRRLPVTWPHLLAFPLHLRLLTDPAFQLPLLGLVHLRNRIEQQRPILDGELLDISCYLEEQRSTDRGLEFDIVTEASSAGQAIWTETSTTLLRTPTKTPAKTTPITHIRRPVTHYASSRRIHAKASLGRHYGQVSGDLNPIHLHALSARAFGFKQAIAHGMWSKARCLAILEDVGLPFDRAFSVEVTFKRPLLLPGDALLEWQVQGNRADFQLLDAQGEVPHLAGEIRFTT